MLTLASALSIGCAPDDAAPVARPEAADHDASAPRGDGARAERLERATPAQLCAAGCDRVELCHEQLLPGRDDAVERCHRECARLDQGRREGMEQLRACLAVDGCRPFAECLSAPPPGAGNALASMPTGEAVTPCEALCGAYADCAAQTDRASLDMAAGLEMRCLTRCQQLEDESADGATPGAPVSRCGGETRCAPLIACVQELTAAVPSETAESTPRDADPRPVCERVCERAVTCQDWGTGTQLQQREAINQCSAQICKERHEPALVRRIETCVREEDCTAFMQCLYQRT